MARTSLMMALGGSLGLSAVEALRHMATLQPWCYRFSRFLPLSFPEPEKQKANPEGLA